MVGNVPSVGTCAAKDKHVADPQAGYILIAAEDITRGAQLTDDIDPIS